MIFGRSPAVWVGAIEAVLALVLSFKIFGDNLDSEQVALIMAVVVAVLSVYTSWATKDTRLGLAVGALKAVAALFAGYGLNLSPDQTAGLIAILTAGFSFTNAAFTEPLAVGTFREPKPTATVPAAAAA